MTASTMGMRTFSKATAVPALAPEAPDRNAEQASSAQAATPQQSASKAKGAAATKAATPTAIASVADRREKILQTRTDLHNMWYNDATRHNQLNLSSPLNVYGVAYAKRTITLQGTTALSISGSGYLLSRAALGAAAGQFRLGLILASFGLRLLAMATQSVSNRTANVWHFNAARDFSAQYASETYARPLSWTDKELGEEAVALMTIDGPDAIRDSVENCAEMSAAVLGIVVSGVMLGVAGGWLLSSVGVAGLLAGVLLNRNKQAQVNRRSIEEREAMIKMDGTMQSIWDDVALGNPESARTLTAQAVEEYDEWETTKTGLTRDNESLFARINLLSTLPVMLCSAFHTRFLSGNIGVMSGYLPLLSDFFDASQKATRAAQHYPVVRERLGELNEACGRDYVTAEEVQGRIKANQLEVFFEKKKQHVPTLMTNLDRFAQVGRWTISGINGTGKSSLSVLLKEHYGEDLFILPAKANLMFAGSLSDDEFEDKTDGTDDEKVAGKNIENDKGDRKSVV